MVLAMPCNSFGANPTCLRKISPCAVCTTALAMQQEKGDLGTNRDQRGFSSGEEL